MNANEIQPPQNQTIYVNNISEKIKIPSLKEKLQILFSKYGTILDVVAHDSLKRRGQAFIVFDNVESAEKAMKEMQNFELEGKNIRIHYAKGKSDAVAKLDGSFEEQRKKRKRSREMRMEMEKEERVKKRRKKELRKKRMLNPPNNTLFVENISEKVKENQSNLIVLKNLFQKYNGCKEVRYIEQKNVAFVDFDTIGQASVVLKELNNARLLDNFLVISFAVRE